MPLLLSRGHHHRRFIVGNNAVTWKMMLRPGFRSPVLMGAAVVALILVIAFFSKTAAKTGNGGDDRAVRLQLEYKRLPVPPVLFTAPVDAIIVPGGGSQRGASARSLPVSVLRRLDLAMARWYEHKREFPLSPLPKIIVLSAGTVHRPNYINAAGWPVSEAASEAQYILEASQDDLKHPIPGELIFQETVSLDTIGNAYFTRVIHTEPTALRRLHVITSGYHMERTRAIFEFVFSISSRNPHDDGDMYRLSFEPSSDADVAPEDLDVRRQRERKSLMQFRELLVTTFGLTFLGSDTTGAPSVRLAAAVETWGIPAATKASGVGLSALHKWIYTAHDAYTSRRGAADRPPVDPQLLNTY
jgi:uncharacterized SAM-binding protein YcdF (DUF218 family)